MKTAGSPIVVVLLDGLGDRAYDALGGATANEAAHTPNLDRLSAAGSCGLLHPLAPGRAPSSELGHWAILGYRPGEFPGRAALEALGSGQMVDSSDVLAYAALRPAERRADGLWLSGRAGVDDEADAQVLLAACERLDVEGLVFTLSYVGRGEAILRVGGGADDRVTDTDPFFRDRHPVARPRPLVEEAQRTAMAVEHWTLRTIAILERHKTNADRRAQGAPPLNVITLKWWGRRRPMPSFPERHGLRGSIVGSAPLLHGLASLLGLKAVAAPDTDEPAQDLSVRLQIAADRLEQGDHFVLCHQKTLDEAGHTKDPLARQRAIEALDHALDKLPTGRAVVCVTGDHATPASPGVIHSGDPVPLVVAGPGVRRDRVNRFGEIDVAQGIFGHVRGSDLMPILLNAADRPLFLGSRPTPIEGADGYPYEIEPLL